MKVAILTQALLNNYGGLLQNYALQNVLKKMGYDAVTIDFKQKNYYEPLLPALINRVLAIILQVFGIKINRRNIPHYQKRNTFSASFVKENINITNSVSSYSTKVLERVGADICLVGSDQVWRPRYNHYLEDMYLKFAKDLSIKKVAYAASFGVDEWEYTAEQTKECSTLAKKFKAISVREESGVDLCKKNLDVDATWVLDPTLLLQKEDYLKICENVPVSSKPYLAAYVLNMTDSIRKECEQTATEKGLELKVFSADAQASLSVPEWLAMFRDASYVVTDSFHGTAFSIIFGKDFKCLYNETRGSARFESLLNLYNSRKLEEKRQFSLNWLKKALES